MSFEFLALPFDIKGHIIDYLAIDEYLELKMACKFLYQLDYKQRLPLSSWSQRLNEFLFYDWQKVRKIPFNLDYVPVLELEGYQEPNDLDVGLKLCARLGLVHQVDMILQHPSFDMSDLKELNDYDDWIYWNEFNDWTENQELSEPINIAIRYGQYDVVKLLLEKYGQIGDPFLRTSLCFYFKQCSILGLLLDSAPVYRDEIPRLVHTVVRNGCLDILEYCFQNNLLTNYHGTSYDMEAAIKCHQRDAAKFLLERLDYRPNADDLNLAIIFFEPDLVRLMVGKGVSYTNLDRSYSDVICHYLAYGHYDIVKELMNLKETFYPFQESVLFQDLKDLQLQDMECKIDELHLQDMERKRDELHLQDMECKIDELHLQDMIKTKDISDLEHKRDEFQDMERSKDELLDCIWMMFKEEKVNIDYDHMIKWALENNQWHRLTKYVENYTKGLDVACLAALELNQTPLLERLLAVFPNDRLDFKTLLRVVIEKRQPDMLSILVNHPNCSTALIDLMKSHTFHQRWIFKILIESSALNRADYSKMAMEMRSNFSTLYSGRMERLARRLCYCMYQHGKISQVLQRLR